MSRSLGLIETRGLIGSIEAADAMLKSADVTLVKQEKVDAALVTVLVQGDVSAVQAAVDAGKEAAKRVGELVSALVIPHPDEEIGNVLLKDKKLPEVKPDKRGPQPKGKRPSKKKEEVRQPSKADSKKAEDNSENPSPK
ncbi:BMC domain-containing protein [Rossellomorea vietnamensis]|uniref:BMC domain-containing protein n=1 Tax=Rossellomorea vietnamensis TaxID=218284 RepID=A0ACD4C3V7_9BACI|nr:BMC domain-containing protein [Rossellomorea vietnamensis]UXH43308.1 BMC domain-containing protein [Rossellomorea vietnamensis]